MISFEITNLRYSSIKTSVACRLVHAAMVTFFIAVYLLNGGPGSSVSITTELRAGRSGIEIQWGRDFPPVQTGPVAHPSSCTVGIGSFPGVEAVGGWG